jgi:outer membrane protein assembly factor BamB
VDRSNRRRASPRNESCARSHIQTGANRRELPQTGAVDSWGGTLSTAGGLVIFGDDSGALMAADAASGKALWSFQTSQIWKAFADDPSNEGSPLRPRLGFYSAV